MEVIYGALGALTVVALLALGAFAGWKARGHFYGAKAERPAAEELKRMEAEQAAFQQMQNYNADVAYGIGGDARQELEGSETA
nr:MAG TPA_asm: hypothetical protein [Caudoviricetes sp.]